MSEGESLFQQLQQAARDRGLRPGPYGVCPHCDTPVLELVRIGEWLVADPCAHQILRLSYLRGKYPVGPQKLPKPRN